MKKTSLLLLVAWLLVGCGGHKKSKTFPIDGFAVAGTATYEKFTPGVSIQNTISITREQAPIPNALIHVVDTAAGNEVIAEGMTSFNGEFIVGLPPDRMNSPLAVRVLTVSGVENFPMMVIDQDDDAHAYFIQSEVFIGVRNDLTIYAEAPLGGAFNVYAQVMRGYGFMTLFGGEEDTKFPELEVRWEDNDVGIDCTCFFTRFFQPDVISLREDENDDSVILHEFGHYLHYNFSHSTSPGGAHFLSCDQNDDPRLTWAEGWATGFSMMVRASEFYIDTDNQNFFIPHENPCHMGQGPVSEVLVAAVYLDLFDGVTNGMLSRDSDTISITFKQIWKAMKNVSLGISLTMYDFYLELLATGAVTAQEWQNNFGALGFDEATMIANSSPSAAIETSDHVPPGADPEFHVLVEQP